MAALDLAKHLVTVVRRYTRRDFSQHAGLSDSVSELVEQNARDLAELDALIDVLVELLRTELTAFLDAGGLDLEATYPFHAGVEIDGRAAMCNLIGELLIHGYDVATAADRSWTLDERDSLLIMG